jgi:hypothetical protein
MKRVTASHDREIKEYKYCKSGYSGMGEIYANYTVTQ